ncbi:hypothetical protein N8561_00760 [bacterium]|nr:hypothetical protein [bacterium]
MTIRHDTVLNDLYGNNAKYWSCSALVLNKQEFSSLLATIQEFSTYLNI